VLIDEYWSRLFPFEVVEYFFLSIGWSRVFPFEIIVKYFFLKVSTGALASG